LEFLRSHVRKCWDFLGLIPSVKALLRILSRPQHHRSILASSLNIHNISHHQDIKISTFIPHPLEPLDNLKICSFVLLDNGIVYSFLYISRRAYKKNNKNNIFTHHKLLFETQDDGEKKDIFYCLPASHSVSYLLLT